jgi:hypothetical protein
MWCPDGHKAGYKIWVGDIPGSDAETAKKLVEGVAAKCSVFLTDANVRGPSRLGFYWGILTMETASECVTLDAALRAACFSCTGKPNRKLKPEFYNPNKHPRA